MTTALKQNQNDSAATLSTNGSTFTVTVAVQGFSTPVTGVEWTVSTGNDSAASLQIAYDQAVARYGADSPQAEAAEIESKEYLETTRRIYCCACVSDVQARLTDGGEIYPHRTELKNLPFWKCDACGNFVGCHYKTGNRTEPLGCIPTKELKEARKRIHALIDPIWKSRRMTRRDVYEAMSRELGWTYHTAKLRTIDEANAAYCAASKYIQIRSKS